MLVYSVKRGLKRSLGYYTTLPSWKVAIPYEGFYFTSERKPLNIMSPSFSLKDPFGICAKIEMVKSGISFLPG